MKMITIYPEQTIEDRIRQYFNDHEEEIRTSTKKGSKPTVWFDTFLTHGFNDRFIAAHSETDFNVIDDHKVDVDARIIANQHILDMEKSKIIFKDFKLPPKDSLALELELESLKVQKSLNTY